MKTFQQNGPPSIQQIVFLDSKNLKDIEINKLFAKQPQRCFEIQELNQNPDLMTNYQYASMVKVLQDWNWTVERGQHEVNSRRVLTRNTFIYTGLKKILGVEQKRRELQIIALYDWYSDTNSNRALTAVAIKKNRVFDDEWHVRKTLKHNMHLDINNYRRRTFLGNEPCTVIPEKCINPSEGNQLTNRVSSEFFSYRLKNDRVRKTMESREVRQNQLRFSHDRSRYHEVRYKDYLKGRFRADDLWNSQKVPKEISQNKQNSQKNLLNLLKSQRISKTAGGMRYYQRRGAPQTKESPKTNGIDGLYLMHNPYDVPLKKKKRRR